MTLSPLSPSFFRNAGALSVALLYTVLTFGATLTPTSVEARTTAAYYTAELAAPAKDSRSIVRGVVWHCEGTTCRAKKSNSRPTNVCKRLSNDMGEITSFTAKGKALADEKLAKCNG
jgi:hypothetical protein